MKFHIVTPQKQAPRLGILKDIKGKPDVEIRTPCPLLHTQGGHIPHITHEIFKLVSKDAQILQIPLVSVCQFKETMQYYDGTISEFIGSKSSLTCLTVNDPSDLTKQGHHCKDQVPIWTKHGKIMFNSTMYMNLIENFQPDMYCLLSDGDTNITSAPKRISKAVEQTILFNKQCLEHHQKSEKLKGKFVIAPIAGGYCLKSRKKCIETITPNSNDVGGFLIDGLHNNGPEVEFLPFDEIQGVIKYVIENISSDKLCAVQGCWNPITIVKLVQLGVDLFDTSYCRILTERSAAMTFAIEEDENCDMYEVNLRNADFAEDFTPIMSSCGCLTCREYTKSYIHHLLTVQELLGPILIMIHNIFHYLRLFRKIRDCISNNRLSMLEQRLSEQYKTFQFRETSNHIEDEFNHVYNTENDNVNT